MREFAFLDCSREKLILKKIKDKNNSKEKNCKTQNHGKNVTTTLTVLQPHFGVKKGIKRVWLLLSFDIQSVSLKLFEVSPSFVIFYLLL